MLTVSSCTTWQCGSWIDDRTMLPQSMNEIELNLQAT